MNGYNNTPPPKSKKIKNNKQILKKPQQKLKEKKTKQNKTPKNQTKTKNYHNQYLNKSSEILKNNVIWFFLNIILELID